MPIQVITPTRVDLAGGTLDIKPLTQILPPSCTVNFGVTLTAEVEIEKSPSGFQLISEDQGKQVEGDFHDVTQAGSLPWLEKILSALWQPDWTPLRIRVKAKAPAGSGLGGSSCLGIALSTGLLKAREGIGKALTWDEKRLIQTVQDWETGLIKVPTGCQDYWGGWRGGLNIIRYHAGWTEVETLRDAKAHALSAMLILCYSGVSRASGTNNWAIFRRAFEGDKAILGLLARMADLAQETAQALGQADWSKVFRLSAEEWQLRTQLWSDIETRETKAIAHAAQEAGAMFSRICGAGGGGVMAIFAEPKRHESVKQALQQAGGVVLEASLSLEGTQVRGSLT